MALDWVWWGGDKKALGRFAVGTDRDTDADLWELIHHLGRRELPRRPLSHPQLRAPWCATVHHHAERLHDATTAAQFGALERGVTWAVVDIMHGKGGQRADPTRPRAGLGSRLTDVKRGSGMFPQRPRRSRAKPLTRLLDFASPRPIVLPLALR